MIRGLGKRQATIAAVAGLAVVTVWGAGLASWEALGVPNDGRDFGDLRTITVSAGCVSAGWSVEDPPCDPTIAPYNYPSLWLRILAPLGASDSWTNAFAWLLMLAFAATVAVLAATAAGSSARWRLATPVMVAGLSPAALLGLQRGNVDIGVLALVTAGALGIAVRPRAWAGALIGLAGALKLFPLGSGVALLVDRPPRRAAAVGFVLVAGAGIALALPDLRWIAERTPQLDGASFGMALLPLLVLTRLGEGADAALLARVFGLTILIATTILFASIRRVRDPLFRLGASIAADRVSTTLALASAGSFLLAYTVGTSFDYRLIVLLPLVSGLARIGTRGSFVAAWLMVAVMCGSYSQYVPSVIQYGMDVALVAVVPAIAVAAAGLVRNRWVPSTTGSVVQR